jgi:hypothetical protein
MNRQQDLEEEDNEVHRSYTEDIKDVRNIEEMIGSILNDNEDLDNKRTSSKNIPIETESNF